MQCLGTSLQPPMAVAKTDEFKLYEDDGELPREVPDMEDVLDATGHVLNQQPAYDQLLNAEIQIHIEDQHLHHRKEILKLVMVLT